jgi:hypothetical protein
LFIPKTHFAKETPEQGVERWWYQVRSVIRCRGCRKCNVRKERTGFPLNKWGQSSLPHALSASWNSMQGRHQCAKAEERGQGNKTSIIAKHGAPEPRISDDSLPGIQHLSRMRVKRKGLTGTSAMG